MRYTPIELPLVGGSSENRGKQLSSALTQNFYIEVTEAGDTVLHPFFGTKAFSSALVNGADRGSTIHNGELYVVTGSRLEKIDSLGGRTLLGAINGLKRCDFASDGQNLFITAGGLVYKFDTALAVQGDTDFENPNTVTYLNSRFIYDGNTNRFVVSEVLDGGNVTAENYGSAESSPDNLLRVYAFDQKLYLFGEKTIEPHYNTETGNPPYARIDTGIMQKGLGSVHSIGNNDLFIYFLGDDQQVYKMKGANVQHISTPAVDHQIQKFSVIDDANGFCFTMQGQEFYFLTFKSENRTFLYSETTNTWVNLSSGVNGDRHSVGSYQFVYGKHLVTNNATGEVFEWDLDTFTDNGAVIQRRRELPTFSGERIKAIGKRLQMSRLDIIMERGVGNITEPDPVIMVEVSIDGRTFKELKHLHPGRAGDFMTVVEYYHIDSFYELKFRITTSDPNFFSIRSAVLYVGVAGK